MAARLSVDDPLERLCSDSDDITALLHALNPTGRDDEKSARSPPPHSHSATEGAAVRESAKRLVGGRSDMLAWIDNLAESPVPERQLKQQERDRRQAAKRAMGCKSTGRGSQRRSTRCAGGEFGALAAPARAYLGLFHDLNDETAPLDGSPSGSETNSRMPHSAYRGLSPSPTRHRPLSRSRRATSSRGAGTRLQSSWPRWPSGSRKGRASMV